MNKKSEIKKKPIKFKFKPSGRYAPCVELKGLHLDHETGEGEVTPKPIVDVLELYGFYPDSDDLWVDYNDPVVAADDELENLGCIVKVKLEIKPLGKGKKNRIGASVDIGGSVAESKTIGDALYKAHKAWNKAGRPINGVRLEAALDRVLKQINAKRG